ncbi:MAG TPA: DNA-3-methyladenine glycosylase 2 family protein [Devosia sp.]|nr:DNA-3-methyladenine glycosylase 2 family protein [Devosia sp.]
MPATPLTDRLDSADVLARHLRSLLRRDARLKAIARRAGPFDIRKTNAGFAGLARVICGQQLSTQSAQAIWSRFEKIPGALDPRAYLRLSEETVRASGFSIGKYRTVRVIAEAILAGELDLKAIEQLPSDAARSELVRHKGIGPWTAEIYLMFCAGHPDIFPAGDLALQKAVGHALAMDSTPGAKELIAIAEPWAPYRHTAALLFWRYYAAVLRRQGGIAL